MDIDDQLPTEETITGSDELLSDDHLRLPESASPLVRLHALRAWLTRRQKETNLELGMAALSLQEMAQDEQSDTRLRRRERQALQERTQQAQQTIQAAQQYLRTYEEAEELLDEYVNHITVSERLLVEYYLAVEELAQNETAQTPRAQALIDVMHRIEHVTTSQEEE